MSTQDRTWRADALTWAVDMEDAQQSTAHEIAGLGARLVAALIDGVIKIVPQGIGVWLLWLFRPVMLEGANLVWLVAALGGVSVLYSTIFEVATGGQTPGKNACALRVISRSGQPALVRQLVVRNLLRLVDWLPLLGVAGALSAFFSPVAQRFGDRVAGTIVVHEAGLRELLREAEVPASVYSTSEDGYLLEAFVSRSGQLREEVLLPLSKQLAQYFYRHYPCSGMPLNDAYNRMQYAAFLQELYRQEKQVPPPVERS